MIFLNRLLESIHSHVVGNQGLPPSTSNRVAGAALANLPAVTERRAESSLGTRILTEEALRQNVKEILAENNEAIIEQLRDPNDQSEVIKELRLLCQYDDFIGSSMSYVNDKRQLDESKFSKDISNRINALRATLKENKCSEGKLALHTENAYLQQQNQTANPHFDKALTQGLSSFEELEEKHKASIVCYEGNVAVASMPRGNDTESEDRSSEDRSLVTSFDIRVETETHPVNVYAVFDGTGGFETADYACRNLPNCLKAALDKIQNLTPRSVQKSLKQAFVELSMQLAQSKERTEFNQLFFFPGSTANVVVKIGKQLYAANVGDSRALIVSDQKTQQLTLDMNFPVPQHLLKDVPENKLLSDEKKVEILQYFRQLSHYQKLFASMDKTKQMIGVFKWGPSITVRSGPRECVRTLGGFISGHQSKPTITMVDIPKEDSILVLTSDGLTHVASTNQIGDFVRNRKDLQPDELAKKLLEVNYAAEILANNEDDKTIMVIKLT
jgi:serine/threonine protein phosphatase PrpC